MKKLTTSKIILFATLVFCAILEIIIVGAWVFFDRSDAAGLAGVIAAPVAVIIGFYEWKAKCENISKYGNQSTILYTKEGLKDITELSLKESQKTMGSILENLDE